MDDSEFKALKHICNGYEKYLSGKPIYKNSNPDFVLKSENKFIIIEHETTPSRKTIVADVFKAAYFLQDEREGTLIIVMTPRNNSTFESYHKHVLPYFEWLKSRTNLIDVVFVLESHYCDNNVVLSIYENEFLQKSLSLNSMLI